MSQEIKLSIISGSHRQQSESVKIARAVEHQLSTLDGVSRDNVGVNLSVDLSVDLIDLANISSCGFIRTDDLGRVLNKSSFEVLGRLDVSDIRGCNSMLN